MSSVFLDVLLAGFVQAYLKEARIHAIGDILEHYVHLFGGNVLHYVRADPEFAPEERKILEKARFKENFEVWVVGDVVPEDFDMVNEDSASILQ